MTTLKQGLLFVLLLPACIGMCMSARAYGHAAAAGIIHPGGLSAQADSGRVSMQTAAEAPSAVAAGNGQRASRNTMKAPTQPDWRHYRMAGPYETVARDGAFAHTKQGSERDMFAALACARLAGTAKDNADREACEANALAIINAYAQTLEGFDGHDAPLCAIQGFWLVRAMTLMRAHAVPAWAAMLRRAMLPMMQRFEAASPYANGNWGAIVNRLRMACGIFLEDSALYQASVDYFLNANDNGSLPRYVGPTGQCQESGRDQAHAQLGLGAQCDICEMAWSRGDDLWGAFDNRLMKGMEYTARYNLGHPVPFETWTDCTGLYCDWTEPGSMGRGRIRDIYRKPYDHYTRVKHQAMPYTRRLLALQARAEKRGEMRPGMEADEFTARGVKEGVRLHRVFTYAAPTGAPLKHDYVVSVRPRGSEEWTQVDTYRAKVNAAVGCNKHSVSEISYALFDFTGDVFVRVVCKKRKFKSARIRPAYRGVMANVQNDSTVQFLLFQPENVSVEFDGDITDNLLLFTSKPPVSKETARLQAAGEKRQFVYYAPGFYGQDTVRISSNSTVYLAGGAYFTGTFAIEDATNVTILGRGIARPENGYEGCHVHRSSNVLIDGLVVNTCPVGESDGVMLRDVRSISHPGWGDGLNVFASSNVVYDRVFCRNSDDCTTAYTTRKGFRGSTRNVTMRNSTLWADVAHPIFIGLHGNAERGDTIENLRYENIDILGQAEPQVDYQGCLAINCGDNNLVRNVTFDNIRIEQILQGCLFHVRVGYNRKYCTAPGRGVEGVVFRNICYNGELPRSLSVISGYDGGRNVRGVSFEGLRVNGRLLHDRMEGKPAWYATADYVPMYVGPHAGDIVFCADARHSLASRSLAYCSRQTDRALESLRPYDFTMMPRNILRGDTAWNLRKASPEEWCSGFWPGILWMDFAYNRSEAVRKAAEGYTAALMPVLEKPVFDHDLGFIAIGSMLKGYEATQNEAYRRTALCAADSLATLFNPAVGTLLSWPRHVKDYGGHNTIMDNMMNLELLFWASEHGGSRRLRDMAVRHAETTMQHQFRADGSCYHVAVYNPVSGRFVKGVTHQGYADNSMWSRGQAWAVYGYTMVYRYTRDPRFLAFARKVTDAYLKRLRETSDDCIPRWDMDAPDDVKDVSAACIVASALLELADYLPADQSARYRGFAVETLGQLATPRYREQGGRPAAAGQASLAFLLHSTGHHPAGTEVDAGIVYADYYYIEALSRLYGSGK